MATFQVHRWLTLHIIFTSTSLNAMRCWISPYTLTAGDSTAFVKYLLIIYYCGMSTKTELTDTACDILKVLGKDADFLYDTIETYIKDAQEANKTELVKIWQTIKEDRKRHMHLLKEALEKEIHS